MIEPSQEILERIIDAFCNGGIHCETVDDIRFHDVYQHDACNYTMSGSLEIDEITYGFIIQDGNWNGTEVLEWGLDDDVGLYKPPEKTRWTFVPKVIRSRALYNVYLLWRKESWFIEKEGNYNYDKHFQPGSVTESYYRTWADSKGLRVGTMDEIQKIEDIPEDLEEFVKIWEDIQNV